MAHIAYVSLQLGILERVRSPELRMTHYRDWRGIGEQPRSPIPAVTGFGPWLSERREGNSGPSVE